MKITEQALFDNGWIRIRDTSIWFAGVPFSVIRLSVTFGPNTFFFVTLWIMNENTILRNVKTMEDLEMLFSLLGNHTVVNTAPIDNAIRARFAEGGGSES